ncbi:MAG: F0F1 ATP synthase subunit A [Anaerolineae bacterium]|nr:F0F1 ATP synthase subunit A [Anaerolineae bacterium]
MSATRRGLILFIILVVVTAIFCVWIPFFVLPGAGLGVGLPVISLPAEVLAGNVLPSFFGYDLTNTLTTLLVVDVILLLIGFAVNRAVSGHAPERFIPRGFTNAIELLVEFWYNQARNVLGEHTGRVLPLALSIFTFVLVANWVKLIPGFETVGILSCAEPNQLGYPLNGNGPLLLVNGGTLKDRAGVKATEADTHACEEKYPQYTPPIVLARKARGVTTGEAEHTPATGTQPATKPATKPATESGALPATDTLTSAKVEGQTTATAKAETGNPDLITVIPYFRPLATDLNMTLALAIVVFFAVQVWGVQALGGSYFYKFVNLPALGRGGMGIMDFVVGLVDILSELSRLISLSFRLLGNIFAGGILLAVMTFMVAAVLPVVFYGLEFFVGAIQAYVFAILTVMYASQAVVSHAHEDHDEAHAEHADAHAQPIQQAELP